MPDLGDDKAGQSGGRFGRLTFTRRATRAQFVPEYGRCPFAQGMRPCYNRGVNQRNRSWTDNLAAMPTPWWVARLALPTLGPMLRGGFFDSPEGLFHGYRLRLLEPGSYRLWAGRYEYETVRNLAIVSSEALVADGRVLPGGIEAASP